MPRIIWRRVRSEWVGRLTAAGPDRFSVVKDQSRTWPIWMDECRTKVRPRLWWKLIDLETRRCGLYRWLRDAKSAAETMK